MKTMDASKARQSFARVLESVRDRNEAVVIVRYGQPVAALVPIARLSPSERKIVDAHSPPPDHAGQSRRA